MGVSVHNVTWFATSSAVGSTDRIEESLNWLTGGLAEITHEKVKSYHGAKMILLRAQIKNKKKAKESICHLGPDLLGLLSELPNLSDRIDDQNILHLRLDISSLVCQSIDFSKGGTDEEVKGRIKLEVYPGENPVEKARDMLSKAAKIATKEGYPLETVKQK
jgi:RNA binding exosome subunit